MTDLSFFVPGLAKTAGSKRAFPFRRTNGSLGVRVTDDAGEKGKNWRTMVSILGKQIMAGKPPLDGPLEVRFLFELLRPKGHFGKHALKPSAPKYPTVKPDLLKLARAVEDALTGIAWIDDAQIVQEHISKGYGSNPGVTIFVTRLPSLP